MFRPTSGPGKAGSRDEEIDLFGGGLGSAPLKRAAPEVSTVSALTRRIRDALEGSFGEVWVSGEVSNFRSPGSGHLYFTLKDEEAVLSAVMFRAEAARLRVALRDGLQVIVRGAITVYPARGQYQIQVWEARPQGQGSLQQQFEALKARLGAEGLFAPERKRELPVFPETVGIVTSLQGAVLQDILQVLGRRAPGIRVLVRGVRVQGAGAGEEIAKAIGAFSRARHAEDRPDLLILARGGGSLEDMWAFNEEIVARALAACSMPTISAVGHETDFTIADFIADLRAPTPSAAAELVSRDWQEWRDLVKASRTRLERATRQVLVHQRQHWARLRESYVFREPRRVVRQMQQRVDDNADAMRAALKRALEAAQHRRDKVLLRWAGATPERRLREARQRLAQLANRMALASPKRAAARRREQVAQLAARIRALSPDATLQRGYAMITDINGKLIRSVETQRPGNPIAIRLSDGRLNAQVTQVRPEVG